MRALDQQARAQLRKYGVRFGAFNIYFPALLKPAAAELALVLWTLKNGAAHGLDLATMPGPAARRPHVAHAGRRHARRVLSRRRLPPVRSARGAHRHAGAPRRPDPPAGVLAHGRSQSVDAAQGRDRRRRLQGHARHDVDPRLLGRGARQRAACARLLGGPPADSGRAAGSRCRHGSRRGHDSCGNSRAGHSSAGRCSDPGRGDGAC